ncbi:guanylate-binding protein 3-like protein [Tanacetum coccineum]
MYIAVLSLLPALLCNGDALMAMETNDDATRDPYSKAVHLDPTILAGGTRSHKSLGDPQRNPQSTREVRANAVAAAFCSFFYNKQLIGKSSGFQVVATHRPCTKGLWLWSNPIKRTTLDETEYNLLILDSEGIDAYDQTMGGIDEAALDRLYLVTEMTKHIRDFFLDLAEDNRKITPRDYLEISLSTLTVVEGMLLPRMR